MHTALSPLPSSSLLFPASLPLPTWIPGLFLLSPGSLPSSPPFPFPHFSELLPLSSQCAGTQGYKDASDTALTP